MERLQLYNSLSNPHPSKHSIRIRNHTLVLMSISWTSKFEKGIYIALLRNCRKDIRKSLCISLDTIFAFQFQYHSFLYIVIGFILLIFIIYTPLASNTTAQLAVVVALHYLSVPLTLSEPDVTRRPRTRGPGSIRLGAYAASEQATR